MFLRTDSSLKYDISEGYNNVMSFLKKIQYNSPVTLTFALVCLGAVWLGSVTGNMSTAALFSVYRSSFSDPLAYVRVFTHVIGHADIEHYFSNFMLILLLGPIVEEKYGSAKIFRMMAITAFVTGVLSIILFPQTMLLGASGITFMLIILVSFVNLQSRRIPITFLVVVVIFIGREVLLGLTVQDNISRLAHIAGGICGAIIGFRLNQQKLKSSPNHSPKNSINL
jgi:membrane associated rhomboid family serine protease